MCMLLHWRWGLLRGQFPWLLSVFVVAGLAQGTAVWDQPSGAVACSSVRPPGVTRWDGSERHSLPNPGARELAVKVNNWAYVGHHW